MASVIMVVENESVPRDRRVWLEAKCLAESGLEVTVISPQGDGYDVEREVEHEGVRIRRFPQRASDGTIRGHLLEYATSAWHIARLLWQDRDRADVVHVANPPDFLSILAVPLKARSGTRIVFDHHDLFPELFESRFHRRGLAYRFARLLERISFGLADAVISTNESYRRIAIDRGGVTPERVWVVRNAPDAKVFVPRPPDAQLRRGREHLGVYVGVMGPQDGVDVALRALAIYRHELGRSDLHVVFVGDGDAVPDCLRLVEELELSDMVEFVGWRPTEDVIDYLSSATVALAPDPPSPLNNHSTMIKVIEYLTMGVPTVSFDLPESVVTAGDQAVFVPGGDVSAFARALAELIDDAERRVQLSAGGMRRAREHLSWEASQEVLREVYRRLLARPLPADLTARSTADPPVC